MHDLRAIRENPEAFDKNWARRGLSAQTVDILRLDEQRRALQTEMQVLLQKRNELSKQIGQIKAQKGNADNLMAEVARIKEQVAALEISEQQAAEGLELILSALPNQLADDVPDGTSEDDNVEIRKYGEPKLINDIKDHVDIGENLGMMDFDTAAKMSGSRFVLLKDGLARMERALAQLMLDTHTQEHGYTECSPPLLVNDQTMYGTTQLPKFADDQFKTTRGDWLIPTAEVTLTNIVADSILDETMLPKRYTAFTPCFRQEAGSAGRDTRGIIRQHQFYKVEMVSVVLPEQSEAEHERMLGCAEAILKKLELPFRTITLCAGDIGFAARKTYDIEVWVPSQNKYREISSCSNCGDIQARRMKARVKRNGAKETEFVHTLNGSGLAVGRTLVAVMENYYDPIDGGVFIPEALQPYMNGLTKLLPPKP
ncbi:MAG: serine--tRNA ligase [Micavibrio aeruginosavorus]|uniref:Serine--tRNA ligase n=1 Tax=Micavibrio aeruginosavorus TaxID=349221 RepID=A0A2W5FR83_9BACT|nr:MAG: serine--tRNA ligase [Micavibrio aeruginosavorus]